MRISWRLGSGYVESVDDYIGVLVPLDEAHLVSKATQAKDASQGEKLEGELDDLESKEERQGMLGGDPAEYTIEGLRKEMREGRQGQWTTYEIKSKLMNKAIGDIGMGSYNWQLFVLCGCGWFADNLWMQGVSLTLPSLSAEFGVDEKTVRYTTSALFVGLSIGSFFWGIGSDFLGRRIAFNTTLLITSVFGIMAAYAQSWGGVCFFFAALGFGVDASSALLTLLSVWWPIGQLASSLVAWYFIANWPVEQGWRYFIVTIGIITFAMFIVRFFIFHLFESPKFLLNKGRQNEAVAVIHGLAYRNGTKTWLTSELLDQVACADDEEVIPQVARQRRPTQSTTNVLREKLRSFSGERLRPLFQNKTLGVATGLIWFCWATIGMGYPLFNAFLPQYFARAHTDESSGTFQSETDTISAETYRNYAIASIMGVPGSLLAAYLVDHPSPFLGRRGTLASSTLLSAIFLFLFVFYGTTSTAQLLMSCVEAFAQNIMYGVLYAFTPEIFPALFEALVPA
ncbi:hypothetical protein NM208_g15354 [Fusarium decemcellulare]|uniref:Uncharacterized protein n=1 Tax=Fusarium decemcellulare TaxID=57161 RepID=A0ACC1RD92_9HYPO|nr:hypothetical protein NM208_g15354 [Fusarium decemcellulare]